MTLTKICAKLQK